MNSVSYALEQDIRCRLDHRITQDPPDHALHDELKAMIQARRDDMDRMEFLRLEVLIERLTGVWKR
jgi:site-specific recombinase